MFVWAEVRARRLAQAVGAAGAVSIATLAGATGPFGPNLILNPGAEESPGATNDTQHLALPFWDLTGLLTPVRYGTLMSPAAPGPSERGFNFFAGGPNNSISSATQVITLDQGLAVIDSGLATYRLSGWLGGALSQDDTMILSATFNDLNGESLGTATLNGPTAAQRNNITSLLYRTRTGPIPAGTRSINIALISSRRFPTYNDGYADNLELILTNPCTADYDLDGGVTIDDLLLFLSDFESGNLDADVDDGSGTGVRDGGVTVDDLLYFLLRFELGC